MRAILTSVTRDTAGALRASSPRSPVRMWHRARGCADALTTRSHAPRAVAA